ncbi:NUDIX hydrolase [Kineosporia sp. J2-2]|uniref:NUDIX hydrolase n=1 Tax=Kineosporia corallincola TaxID=2835133 RepID=A0ABS5TT66_9ACTN|nr:NUDIX hydrolase [Kineosporia corallincola]MBT0773978.1 NUDIX hydrolase [Kineosporia corallincola]
MTHSAADRSRIRFWHAHTVTFTETPSPVLEPRHEMAMNMLWQQWTADNPLVFDGPVSAVSTVSAPGPDRIDIAWYRSTYRRQTLRRVPGATPLVTLFVAVAQPTPAGLLLGRTAAWTGTGHEQWVLPGGTVEPPAPGRPLTEHLLREHAARELAEETGIHADPARLTRWALARNPNGNVGFFFRAEPITEPAARERFSQHVSEQARRGEAPELTSVQFAGNPYRPDTLEGPLASTLPALLDRYAAVHD